MNERKTIPFDLELVPVRDSETNEETTVWRIESDHMMKRAQGDTASEALRNLADDLKSDDVKLRAEPIAADD